MAFGKLDPIYVKAAIPPVQLADPRNKKLQKPTERRKIYPRVQKIARYLVSNRSRGKLRNVKTGR